jgi:hypothetical protein
MIAGIIVIGIVAVSILATINLHWSPNSRNELRALLYGCLFMAVGSLAAFIHSPIRYLFSALFLFGLLTFIVMLFELMKKKA